MTGYIIAAALTAAGAFCLWQNDSITVSTYSAESSGLLRDISIAHISDLHNKRFGKNQRRLLEKTAALLPDYIFITGDLIDRRRTGLKGAEEFLAGAVKIAPVYFVPGNHEAWGKDYEELKRIAHELGVIVLEDDYRELDCGVRVIGAADPGFFTTEKEKRFNEALLASKISGMLKGGAENVLLVHRPEYLSLYAGCGVSAVFCGHAHGGQVRLPFIGGLYAPDQGLFPKLTAGVHTCGNTAMYISRGLSNSLFPLRVFNRPQIVHVTLHKKA